MLIQFLYLHLNVSPVSPDVWSPPSPTRHAEKRRRHIFIIIIIIIMIIIIRIIIISVD